MGVGSPEDGARPGGLERAAVFSLRALLVVAALVVAGMIFMRLRIVFVPVIVAVLIAVALVPPARRLERAGVPRRAASALVFVAALAVVAGGIAVLAPRFIAEFATLGTAITGGIIEVRDWLVEGPLGLSPARIDEVVDYLLETAEANVGLLTSGATVLIQIGTGLIVALVLSVFFTSGGDGMWSWFVRMTPRRHRGAVDASGRRAWSVLSGYLAGSAIDGLIEAAIVGVALLIIGVPLVLPLMVLTFVAAFFPLIGAVFAGVIAVLVALVSEGWLAALVVGIVFILIQQLEGNLLAPFVLGRAVRLHPAVVLVVLIAGASLGGIIGAFLSVPFAAVVWGIIKELVERDVIEPPGDEKTLLDGPDATSRTRGGMDELKPAPRTKPAGDADPGDAEIV
jgi:putative heme transporter